jgi:protein-S-isoprenylcysteine O-methyltransferase Ste14
LSPSNASASASPAPRGGAEPTLAARLGAVLFKYRGFIPVPFLLVVLLAPGHQTRRGWLVGLLLVALGEGVRLAGVAAAGTTTRRRSRRVERLVTYGVFAWVRNPLYVGNLLAWMGFVVASGVLWFVPIAIVLFALEYTLIVRFEEGLLESHFGREYLEYKARTPRWLPRPPAHPAHPAHGPHDWAESWRSEVSTFLQYVAIVAALLLKARYF